MKKKIIILVLLVVVVSSSAYAYLKNQIVTLDNETKEKEEVKEKEYTYTFEYTKKNKVKETLITNINNHDIYYYHENTKLNVCDLDVCIEINDALKDGLITLENFLSKAKSSEFAYDGGSGIYYFDDFNVIVCHKNKSNGQINENIYIGKKALKDVSVCK